VIGIANQNVVEGYFTVVLIWAVAEEFQGIDDGDVTEGRGPSANPGFDGGGVLGGHGEKRHGDLFVEGIILVGADVAQGTFGIKRSGAGKRKAVEGVVHGIDDLELAHFDHSGIGEFFEVTGTDGADVDGAVADRIDDRIWCAPEGERVAVLAGIDVIFEGNFQSGKPTAEGVGTDSHETVAPDVGDGGDIGIAAGKDDAGVNIEGFIAVALAFGGGNPGGAVFEFNFDGKRGLGEEKIDFVIGDGFVEFVVEQRYDFKASVRNLAIEVFGGGIPPSETGFAAVVGQNTDTIFGNRSGGGNRPNGITPQNSCNYAYP